MMAYTGRLRPKGVPFLGFRYMKGYRNLSFRSVKRPQRVDRCIVFYGYEKVEQTF